MTMSSSSRRRRRDNRPDDPRPMREGANDRQIVRLVYDYRVLSQNQLERLLGRSRSTVQRLLRRLYDHRYLERVFLPISYFGSSPALYILDRRGIDLLQRMGVDNFVGLPSKQMSAMYLEHTLATNEFRIAVSLACQRNGWEVETWLTDNEMKADYDRVKIPSRKQPVSLIPDSYFSIHVPDRGTTNFFLELDRGTMPIKRFREKLEAYVAYYKTGAFTKRYAAKGFRVLTVVDGIGEGRVENLVNDAAQVTGGGRRFWFIHLDRVEPATILTQPIWSIAGQAEHQALI